MTSSVACTVSHIMDEESNAALCKSWPGSLRSAGLPRGPLTKLPSWSAWRGRTHCAHAQSRLLTLVYFRAQQWMLVALQTHRLTPACLLACLQMWMSSFAEPFVWEGLFISVDIYLLSLNTNISLEERYMFLKLFRLFEEIKFLLSKKKNIIEEHIQEMM